MAVSFPPVTDRTYDPDKIQATHRSPTGQFLPGNPGGPGYSYLRKAQELKRTILHEVSLDDVSGIMRAMINEALAGNIFAAKLVFSYTIGEPSKELTDYAKKDMDSMMEILDLVPVDKLRELAK